jgi:uncharacterized protein (DUF885 family)
MLKENPETATFLGVDKGARAGLRHELTDRTPAGADHLRSACAEHLTRLKSVAADRLLWREALDIRATRYALELADEGYRQFDFGDNLVLSVGLPGSSSPYAVSQSTGFYASIPDFLDTQHKIRTVDDADAYLDRLSAFAHGLDGETERLRRDGARGVVAPDFILDTVLRQQQAYIAKPPSQWGLVKSIAQRASKAAIKGDWNARALALCEREVGPAIVRQVDRLQQLRAATSSDAGVWKLPQGESYYAWALKVGTTTVTTPEDVHQAGLEQVARLNGEMDRLLSAQGMTKGTVGNRLAALSKDSRQLYPDSDAGRDALIAYLNRIVQSMRARLPSAFVAQHKADLVIRRVPTAIEAGAPYGYEIDGSIDGTRPAAYYINLQDMANWPRFTLPTLCFHEGVPGHVWQGTYTHGLPLIRSQFYFNAYVEGWGLYAEQLADELGMYDHDPFGRLGYLQSVQFRACRLVLDTGLHVKRWSRSQAIHWLIENNGLPDDAARGEVDRYCVWPGQACGYAIGLLELQRLRARASSVLGTDFSLRAFHETILQAGPVPLTVLKTAVDRYAPHKSD